jgi:hypothetical protein
MENEQITLSVGRDYRSTTKYEYVVFKGEEVLVRAGFFASAAKARREGIKAAKNLGVA